MSPRQINIISHSIQRYPNRVAFLLYPEIFQTNIVFRNKTQQLFYSNMMLSSLYIVHKLNFTPFLLHRLLQMGAKTSLMYRYVPISNLTTKIQSQTASLPYWHINLILQP